MKTTRGMIISICDYELYQQPENYESNHEWNNEMDTKGTTKGKLGEYYKQECIKNDKNEKNGEEIKESEIRISKFEFPAKRAYPPSFFQLDVQRADEAFKRAVASALKKLEDEGPRKAGAQDNSSSPHLL